MDKAAMREKMASLFERHTFWLALLCHLLLLFSFSMPLSFMPEKEKSPAMYIPSYVYHGETNSIPKPPQPEPQPQQPQKKIDTDQHGVEKPVAHESQRQRQAQAMSQSNQFQEIDSPQNEQPVHLIGDKNVDAPLLKLLGQGISAHLIYPKIALDFNLKGVALIRFIVHPNGQITNVQLVKSSSAGVLDDAALAAINSMSPVYNVGKYVDKPQPIVFGIIFG